IFKSMRRISSILRNISSRRFLSKVDIFLPFYLSSYLTVLPFLANTVKVFLQEISQNKKENPVKTRDFLVKDIFSQTF
ncbi:hypothetical protein A4365_08465, partial [Streptococcus pneumoniae]